jgi:multiple sugar transport system permease protein
MATQSVLTQRSLVMRISVVAILLVMSIPFIFPFIWMVLGSVKSINELLDVRRFLPSVVRWSNFREAIEYQPFLRHYANSLYIAVTVTSGTIFVASLSGYAFARIPFPGRSALFLVLLSGLMMPVEVAIIPNFFLMRDLNLTNTHWPLLIIPIFGARGVMATFIMRTYFLNLPGELEEAARLDGLGPFGIFWKIMLPLAGPAIGSVSILTFLHTWNNFLEPLVYVNDVRLFTIPLSLNNFTDGFNIPAWHLQLAATTMAVVPMIVIYVFAQRHITNAMALSGLKG